MVLRGRTAKASAPHPPGAGATTQETGAQTAGSAPPMGPHASPGSSEVEGAKRRAARGTDRGGVERGGGQNGLQGREAGKASCRVPATPAPSGHRQEALCAPPRGGPGARGAALVPYMGVPPPTSKRGSGTLKASSACRLSGHRAPGTPSGPQPAAT